MEIGNTPRPVVYTPPMPVRSEHLGAVKTELAAEAAVQQAGKAPPVRFATKGGPDSRAATEESVPDAVERDARLDPATHALLVQAMDDGADLVVRQLPQEATRRLRAYLRRMREMEGDERDDAPHVEKVA